MSNPEKKTLLFPQAFKWEEIDDFTVSKLIERSELENFRLYPSLIRYPSGTGDIAEGHKRMISSFIENRLTYFEHLNLREGLCFDVTVFHYTDSDSFRMAFLYDPKKIYEDDCVRYLKTSIEDVNYTLSKLGNRNTIEPIP